MSKEDLARGNRGLRGARRTPQCIGERISCVNANYVTQSAELRQQQKEDKIVRELEEFIAEQFDLQSQQIGKEFGKTKDQLDKIEEDVRGLGNGKPDVSIRLDHLGNIKN